MEDNAEKILRVCCTFECTEDENDSKAKGLTQHDAVETKLSHEEDFASLEVKNSNSIEISTGSQQLCSLPSSEIFPDLEMEMEIENTDFLDDLGLCFRRLFDEDSDGFHIVQSNEISNDSLRRLSIYSDGFYDYDDIYSAAINNFVDFFDTTPETEYICCGTCFSSSEQLKQERISWKLRPCCMKQFDEELPNFPELFICDNCLKLYISSKLEQGIPFMKCPGTVKCEAFLSDNEIKEHTSDELFEKYQRMKLDIRGDPCRKTCPGCSMIYTAKDKDEKKVCCSSCFLIWCFRCHGPWHEGISCTKFQKGDRSLKTWAKNIGNTKRNAQRCPKCKIFIQKNGGCDHMSCSRCGSEFCYRCGDRYVDLGIFGNHHSKFSVLGCKYEFKPDSPVQRVVTRGACLTGQVVLVPVAAGLLAGAGCVAVAGAIAASPVLIPYKVVKKYRKKKRLKEAREDFSC